MIYILCCEWLEWLSNSIWLTPLSLLPPKKILLRIAFCLLHPVYLPHLHFDKSFQSYLLADSKQMILNLSLDHIVFFHSNIVRQFRSDLEIMAIQTKTAQVCSKIAGPRCAGFG